MAEDFPEKRQLAVDTSTGEAVDTSVLPAEKLGPEQVAAGQVTAIEQRPTAKVVVPTEPIPGDQWYYCLNPGHGGVDLGDDGRQFQHDPEGCPVCPVCTDPQTGKHVQVSAVAIPNEKFIPNLEPRPAYGA